MRVLVIDHNWLHTPYFCAALAACGNEVIYVSRQSSNGSTPARGVRRVCFDVRSVTDLDRVIREQPADIVYLTTEHLMALSSKLPTETAERIFPKVSSFQRRHCDDRRELYALLLGSNVVFPGIVDIECDDDLKRATQQFGFPLVVRGIGGAGGGQVRIVKAPDALEGAVAQIRDASPDGMFVQRFVAGRRCIVGALSIEGRARQLIMQRVLETYPHETSPSLINRSFHSESLAGSAETVLALLQWTGFGSMDFIEDEHGQFHFLEFNPRLWGSVQVAEVCGVPMIDAFSRLINGREQLPRRYARLNRTVALFPQYIVARLDQGRLLSVREVLPVLRCMADAPLGLSGVMSYLFGRVASKVRNTLVRCMPLKRRSAASESKAAPRYE